MINKNNNPIKIQTKDGTLFGYFYENGKVRINAGSLFINSKKIELSDAENNLRALLIDYGYVRNGTLIKDYLFDNFEVASKAMLGRFESFYTIDNINLSDYISNISISTRPKIEQDDINGYCSTIDFIEDYDLCTDLKAPSKNMITKQTLFQRDNKVAKKAIARNQFKCMLNPNHTTFLTKQSKPYMEAHHLIPLSCQNDFEVSLDVEANIVCLCANCHRMLHYGKDIKDSLKYLYDLKITELNNSGIYITFEQLLSYYK